MHCSCDPSGFPLIAVAESGLEVHLLPVTKVQFERFLAEPNAFGDTWYEQILPGNPRIPPHGLTTENREGLFLSGVLPGEALAFARWLGEDYDLPPVQEWRAAYAALQGAPLYLPPLLSQCPARPVGPILEGLVAQLCPSSLLDLSLMRGGLVEWVRQDSGWAGLGSPRPAFQPNLWDPLAETVRPIRPGERVPYFGFRLVRRTTKIIERPDHRPLTADR